MSFLVAKISFHILSLEVSLTEILRRQRGHGGPQRRRGARAHHSAMQSVQKVWPHCRLYGSVTGEGAGAAPNPVTCTSAALWAETGEGQGSLSWHMVQKYSWFFFPGSL